MKSFGSRERARREGEREGETVGTQLAWSESRAQAAASTGLSCCS